MTILLLHGSFVSWKDNWLSWLKNELESIGQTVITPEFPVDSWDDAQHLALEKITTQNLRSWQNYFQKTVEPKMGNEPIGVVAHSLGPLFLLHLMEMYPKLQIEFGIFVAPFFEKLERNQLIDQVNKTFYKDNFNWTQLTNRILLRYAIFSEYDPYVDILKIKNFVQNLSCQSIPSINSTHFGRDLKQFPLVLELCKTRIPFQNRK